MKKIFLFFVLSLISTSIFAQIKITPYFDGYWGNWNTSSFEIRGSYSGFMFYNETQGPWDCYFKFSIDNYRLPDSKQRKKDYKLGIWYEFTGTVEYYICDDYPTIYDLFKSSRRATFVNPQNPDGRPTKKVTSKAIIKIAAFKDYPVCYNIWFDNVGLGIDLNNFHF